jgi:diguanylate cyclase (GGDEF)-like protein
MSHDALKDLLTLLQLTEQLSDGRGLEDALRAITEATLAILPGDHASIRLLDATHTHLLASARAGIGRDTPSILLRAGEGISGWVLTHGRPARVVDVRDDPRFLPIGEQGFAIASMVVEPLISEGKTIGVLSVSSPEVNSFAPTDELMARLLANCSVAPIQRARLERLAVTDDLTLAFNSRYLTPRLLEEMERARRGATMLSVLLMDLDHFKRVNDTHGHAIGDRVLRAFADRVRANTRRIDLLVRRGGEEFVLIMPSTPPIEAAAIAERVRDATAREPIEAEGERIVQTVSIGIATWDGRESPADLERRADHAMYDAKERGRDQIIVADRPSGRTASGVSRLGAPRPPPSKSRLGPPSSKSRINPPSSKRRLS